MIKLDLFDRKIITELDRKSNISLLNLSRKIRRSKQFVLYRMKRMEEGGLIQSYNAIVDLGRLGILTYRFYFKMRSFDRQDEKEFLEFLSGFKEELLVIAALHGKWDYGIILGVESIARLHEIWRKISKKYMKKIRSYNFSVYSPIHNFNRSFVNQEKGILERVYGKEERAYKSKIIDRKILDLYAKDTRAPLTKIAKKLKVSLSTVRTRIKKLEKEKVICGYKLGLDLRTLGLDNYRVDIYLKSSQRLAELHTHCKYKPNIYQVHYTIGGAGMELELFVRNLKELIELMNDLKSKFNDTINYMDYFSYSAFLRMNHVPD